MAARDGSVLRILRNAGGLMAGRLSADLLSFALFLLLSRRFGPEGIGEFSTAFAIASLVGALVALGFEDYGIREYTRGSVSQRQDLMARLLAAQVGIMVVACAGLGAFVAWTAPSASAALILASLTVHTVLLGFARTLFIPAFAEQAMLLPAASELGCRLLGMGITAALALLSHTSLAVAVCGYPLGTALQIAIALASAGRRLHGLRIGASAREIAALARVTWHFGASELVFLLHSRADLMLLSWLQGNAIAGLYATSLKFVEVGRMPVYFLGFAAYPQLSSLLERGGDTRESSELAARLLAGSLWLTAGIGWALLFVVPDVVVPLLGPRFQDAGPAIRWMVPLLLVNAVENVGARLMLAAQLQQRKFRFQIGSTALNIALNALMIPDYGIAGSVCAAVLAQLALIGAYAPSLSARIDLARMAPPLYGVLAAGVAGGIAGLCAGSSGVTGLAAACSLAAFLAVLGGVHCAWGASLHPGRSPSRPG